MSDLPAQPPKNPPAGVASTRGRMGGFFLGVTGMAFYLAGVQMAWRGALNDGTEMWQVGPIVAGVGCMLFCAAIALIWRLSLKRLILLVLLAGVMVGGASQVGLATSGPLSKRFQRNVDTDASAIPATPAEEKPASANP